MPQPPDDRNDWIRYSNLDQSHIPLVTRRSRNSRLVLSVFLIAAGVLLFLSNLGIMPIWQIWIFWPLFPLISGLLRLTSGGTLGSRMWGGFAVGFGVLFLLSNLGVIHLNWHDGRWAFSLGLIAVGFVALVSVLESSRQPQAGSEGVPAKCSTDNYQDALNDLAIFGHVKRRSESQAFQGGELTSIFGNIEVDLRRALISAPSRSALLNVTAVLGAVQIKVPQSWRIHVAGTGILGSFEDNTVPPNTGLDAPTLVITGSAVLGAVQIED
ncbi:MAG: cell wall-active antibiotics response protein [Acidobacteriota bacterium]|nr:cell wall-active antibiotics response protein [Acidobacteriota bacterium]